MVRGLIKIPALEGVCECCVLGKHHRSSFPLRKAWRVRDTLKLIHNDICGSMHHPLLYGAKYLITFIIDYNRRVWVYFIEIKSEAFNVF